MTPDAKILDQKTSNRLSNLENLIILCGHYKGVDQRVRDQLITMEISIEIMFFQVVNSLLLFFATLWQGLYLAQIGDSTSALQILFKTIY